MSQITRNSRENQLKKLLDCTFVNNYFIIYWWSDGDTG